MYTGNKQLSCRRCGKKTTWVRCSNCNGQGSKQMTTCSNKCAGGYKCENGTNDPYHQ